MNSDEFCEKTLKGKNKSEIVIAILRLKREMNYLKDRLERRSIGEVFPIDRSEVATIQEYRTCIQKAHLTLEKAGKEYQLTDAEKFAVTFQQSIPYIRQIDFTIGGFFEGYSNYVATLKDGVLSVSCRHDNADEQSRVIINWEEDSEPHFFNYIHDLYMGEWRRQYSASYFDIDIMDGVSWEVQVHYSNSLKPVTFSGNNSFPYNFSAFQKLFGIYEEELDVNKYV